MKAAVEGYGCSLNQADTQSIKGLLEENCITLSRLEDLGKGDLAVINACAVKETTEKRMLSRIQKLFQLSKKQGFELIVFGCISRISSEKVAGISKSIVQMPPALEELSKFLKLGAQEFSPSSASVQESQVIAIIPICRGCLGNCSYCAVKKARGSLKSYGIEELKKRFEKEINAGRKEIWLTAQDCGCYGFDIGTSLAGLLKELLKVEGDFRIRLGMMNVQHLKKFLQELLEQMSDERIFKFLHLPLQSGSNRLLKLMNREYSVAEWLKATKIARRKFPELAIATDIIVGFPTETEREFEETLKVLKKAGVDVVNISRFGKRPFTQAAGMKDLDSKVKKARSRKAALECEKITRQRNKRMVGKIEAVLFDEKGKKGGMIARAGNYKPVVLEKGVLGEFAKARVEGIGKTFLKGKLE